LALEIAEVLGVAFYNQQRFVRHRKTRFDYLLSHDLIKEEELESAWKESREKNIHGNFLMQITKYPKAILATPSRNFITAVLFNITINCRFQVI